MPSNKFKSIGRISGLLAFCLLAWEAEDYLSPEGYSFKDAFRLSAMDGQCFYASRTDRLETETQKDLFVLFDMGKLTETGRYILDQARADGTLICSSDNMDSNLVASVAAAYYYEDKILALNAVYSGSIYRAVSSMLHELRHKDQVKIGFSDLSEGNFRPKDLMIMTWLIEADARLLAILFAYEAQQQGQPEYLEELIADYNYLYLWEAFEGSLVEKPGDMRAAMQSVIYEFRNNQSLACTYDDSALRNMDKRGYEFDPDVPVTELMSDDKLMALGKISTYPNYMDKKLMAYIRASITDVGFENSLLSRQNLHEHPNRDCMLLPSINYDNAS